MVKVCPYSYDEANAPAYQEYFDTYPYPLHDFQKWCVEGIVTGNHVLACAPTGSGKTFGGEFALQYFHSKGKKTIYTSPIKALSNEKFHSFTQKYPQLSVGLITGDIKTNPDADVLIMTTEILVNKLYQLQSKTEGGQSSATSFDMDIQNDLGCVVFDEIHFINDEARGHVWEQCIMLLPSHIQMIGLSATLDNPEKFARWLETKGNPNAVVEKEVYLTRKQVRAVPLIHYSFISVTNVLNKAIRDKETQSHIKKLIDKPVILQNAQGVFQDAPFQEMTNALKLFEKHDLRVKRQHVLNKVTEYLVENEMLPALCYVFSRKQLEQCAEELTTNLLEFDSKVPYTVDRECEQIIRKLPNFEEYLHLPEYVNTVKLLRKGVGIHHAGLMPVLREMVEILFARGFIKVLFCTETMSVGINLPVKTTIFTDVHKFNGSVTRTLYSHEYTQAAGRAGRLGLDTVGHVIHLNNLFRPVDGVSYRAMMNGKPQALSSKFKISYHLLLNLLDIGDNELTEFAGRSMLTGDLDDQKKDVLAQMAKAQKELNAMPKQWKTQTEVLIEYNDLKTKLPGSVNKKRRELERSIQALESVHGARALNQDLGLYLKVRDKETEIHELQTRFENLACCVEHGVNKVLDMLTAKGFIEDTTTRTGTTLTPKGKTASQLKEVHGLVFADFYHDNKLSVLSVKQLVALFSCFTNLRVADDVRDEVPKTRDPVLLQAVQTMVAEYQAMQDEEVARGLDTGFDYTLQFDLLDYTEEWCDCQSVEECKWVLQKMGEEKEIFLGEFVKALLKINNISAEFEKIAELNGHMELLSKLKDIPHQTLKYVVTNQSLYV